MEGAVAFEVLRFVDEAILAAQIGIDDTQIVPDGFAGLIEEDYTASLGCQLVEGLLSVGEERFGFGAEDVNRYISFTRGGSSVGRAPGLQPGGRGFDSHPLHW